jgi:hypothetical protein
VPFGPPTNGAQVHLIDIGMSVILCAIALGYFIETADLNYQVDGLIRGFRAEDRRFPGISRVDDSVVLQWAGGGTLQSAPAVTGSWSNVHNASSPHSAPLTGRQQYFRVRP